MTALYGKAWKEQLGEPEACHTSEPGKGMEQIIWSAMTPCVLHHWGIRPSQHKFKQVLLN